MPTEASPAPTVLVEHRDSEPIGLSPGERDALRALAPGLSATEVAGERDLYVLNPGSVVGAVRLGSRRFVLRPKVEIRRLLFLLSYSLDPRRWLQLGFDFAEDDDVFEAVIPGFAFQLEEALRHGLAHDYRLEESALPTVRGRIRISDQIRSRFGLVPPVECSYDEFTADVVLNQLLKAAITRLGEVGIRHPESRARLRSLAARFANVSSVPFDPRLLPEVRFNRLNEHFRGPVELAKLILRARSFDARDGSVSGASFLVDLARVFEDFVVVALREALGLSPALFPRQAKGRRLHLDADEKLRLRPDISWWNGQTCLFVGDVKYKKTASTAGVRHPDVYQLLAYTTATGLPKGLLVYAAGEEVEQSFQLPLAGKQIDVLTLDLDLEPDQVLDRVGQIADLVRIHAEESATPAPAGSTA